jgi:hypothetical protein
MGLVAQIAVLPLMARQMPRSYSLLMGLGWGSFLLTVGAILLARRAAHRIQDTRDQRGLMMAQFGLILGWGTVAYVVLSNFVELIRPAGTS